MEDCDWNSCLGVSSLPLRIIGVLCWSKPLSSLRPSSIFMSRASPLRVLQLLSFVACGVLDLLRSSLFWEAFSIGVCFSASKERVYPYFVSDMQFHLVYSVSFTLSVVSAQYCVIFVRGFLVSVCYQIGGISLGVRLAFPWWSMDWVVDPCLWSEQSSFSY